MSVLADRLLAVDDALSEAVLAHAFGGAIALGYCTFEPRGTRDLDLNVFVAPERVKEVFAALPDGVTVTTTFALILSGLVLMMLGRDVRCRWQGRHAATPK